MDLVRQANLNIAVELLVDGARGHHEEGVHFGVSGDCYAEVEGVAVAERAIASELVRDCGHGEGPFDFG